MKSFRISPAIALFIGGALGVVLLVAFACYWVRGRIASTSTVANVPAVESITTTIAPKGHEDLLAMATHDLNHDTVPETVGLKIVRGADGFPLDGALLVINDEVTHTRQFNPVGDVAVVDVDWSDQFSEVAVSDYGPSSDPTTAFFAWDGTRILERGRVSGLHSDILFNGDGTLQTTTRGRMLDTWFHRESFRLVDGRLQPVPQAFYERLGADLVPLSVRKPLRVVTSPQGGTSFVLAAGESLTIAGCDEVRWCKVRDAKGREGWFALEEFGLLAGTREPIEEYIDGLNHAD